MKIIGYLALASILLTHTFVVASGQSQKEVMTNASVIGLVKAGLGDAVIIQKIRRSEPRFDTSDAGLKQLKAAGVSDDVILEMMNVGNSAPGAGTEIVRPPYPAPTTPPNQPRQSDDLYASVLDGSAKHRLNGSHTSFVRAKVKGKEMTLASLAASSAVNEAVHDVLMEGVYKASSDILFSSVGRNLLFPGMTVLGGMAGGVGIVTDKVGSVFGGSTPSIIALLALEKSRSETRLKNTQPQFEIFYADIPGINPDEYLPQIIKMTVTKDNYRLRGAAKIKDSKILYEGFLQEIVPTETQNLARGHAQIRPKTNLGTGEYGLVLFPVVTKKTLTGENPQENAIFVAVWDFSIEDPSANVVTTVPTSLTQPNTGPDNNLSSLTNNSKPPATLVAQSGGESQALGQDLPVYGKIEDIKGFRKVYVHADNEKSRERILKVVEKDKNFEIVNDPTEAQIVLEYKVLSHDSTVERGARHINEKSQMTASYLKDGKRVTAWSDTSEFAQSSEVIGFRTQYSEIKLTERFLKALKKVNSE